MTAETAILVLLCLFTKHLIVDFPLQVPYHYLNKGTYGHPGGIAHATLHAAGTLIALTLLGFALPVAGLVALVDGVVHYHVDWAKMNLNARLGLKPDNSEKFWWLLGLDQYLHALTYLAIVWWLI